MSGTHGPLIPESGLFAFSAALKAVFWELSRLKFCPVFVIICL